MSKQSRIDGIRIGVGTPEPKTVPVMHGGPTVAFQIRDDQQVSLAVEALDAEGNPASATIAFTSSDETVVAVTDNGDGTALAVASPGAGGLGTATITATATDNSDGDVHLGTFDIEVVAGDVVIVNVVAGTPEAKAPVEPPEEPPVA
ncbi:MAG: hypothetical protein ACOYB2_10670 [Limnohabitans sp.]